MLFTFEKPGDLSETGAASLFKAHQDFHALHVTIALCHHMGHDGLPYAIVTLGLAVY